MKPTGSDQQQPGGMLVCFAVREEAKDFKRAIAKETNVSVLVTGMGRRNSERALRDFLEHHQPAMVFTCGFAGALDPGLKIGDVLFEAKGSSKMRETLCSLGAAPGNFHCSERVAVTVAEKAELRRTTGADAVEMESSVIHALCHEQGIPSVTVRVISDVANEDLPLNFNALMTADQRISMWKLAKALLRSPGAVPRLLSLQRNTQLAAQRLAGVLCGLLSALRHDRARGV